jgi:SAM-dependent methyltransferase
MDMFLSLGPTPLANSYLRSEQEFCGERSYPLDVYFCRTCSLVQLLDVVNPEVMFRHYLYVTGTSDTIAAHNAVYARTVVECAGLCAGDLVIEIASNDGSLLKQFHTHGVRTLGVEPARNLAEMSRAAGISTVDRFFDSAEAPNLREEYGPVKAVIANNVLAHVDDTRGFLCGCKTLLVPGGLAVIEVPYIREMIDRTEYDTIYHEHLCYFSVTALMRLCNEAGLSILRVDFVPVHGGSLRIYAGAKERGPHAPEVCALAAAEHARGLDGMPVYTGFAGAVATNRARLLELLHSLRAQGASIAAYGAPAKGNTLLNYCRIGTDLVSYTVDKNSLKVGLFTPGMHLPIRPLSALLEDRPDYALILAWNFSDEIMRQQREYRDRGGRFIVPIPKPKVI